MIKAFALSIVSIFSIGWISVQHLNIYVSFTLQTIIGVLTIYLLYKKIRSIKP